MKHFRLEGILKPLNVILLLCHAMLSHVLLQLFVFAIALLHIKHWVRSVMLLRIAA